MAAVFYALNSIALCAGLSRTFAVGVTVKAALLSASLITPPAITGFVILLWAALAVTTGRASRSHRAYVAEVEKRARRAEQARWDESNRRVGEGWLRVARELHDAVGHHVALMNVQADALACLLVGLLTASAERASVMRWLAALATDGADGITSLS